VTRSPIMDTAADLVFHSAIVLSLYFLFAGHNQPGGGFVGGLTAGAAIVVYYVAGGVDEVKSLSRFRPWTILGGGLVLASLASLMPLVAGDSVLQSGYVELDVPGLGPVKALSTLVFDSGVYAVVVGLVLMVFEALADEPEAGGSA
jgi:multisubunit Na+/H+ antiporter MnhB subunit